MEDLTDFDSKQLKFWQKQLLDVIIDMKTKISPNCVIDSKSWAGDFERTLRGIMEETNFLQILQNLGASVMKLDHRIYSLNRYYDKVPDLFFDLHGNKYSLECKSLKSNKKINESISNSLIIKQNEISKILNFKLIYGLTISDSELRFNFKRYLEIFDSDYLDVLVSLSSPKIPLRVYLFYSENIKNLNNLKVIDLFKEVKNGLIIPIPMVCLSPLIINDNDVQTLNEEGSPSSPIPTNELERHIIRYIKVYGFIPLKELKGEFHFTHGVKDTLKAIDSLSNKNVLVFIISFFEKELWERFEKSQEPNDHIVRLEDLKIKKDNRILTDSQWYELIEW